MEIENMIKKLEEMCNLQFELASTSLKKEFDALYPESSNINFKKGDRFKEDLIKYYNSLNELQKRIYKPLHDVNKMNLEIKPIKFSNYTTNPTTIAS